MRTEIIEQPETKPKSSGLALLGNVVVLLVFAALFAALYHKSVTVSSHTKFIIHALSRGNLTGLQAYIQAWGGFKAPLVSASIMIFQSFAVPFPTFIVTSTNGLVFGIFWGALLSLSSAMVGATLCFIIAQGIGRPLAERFLNKKALDSLDGLAQRYGVNSLLVFRLVPLIPFNTLVSYASGFTSMSFRRFILASGIGQLPVMIAYSWLGNKMHGAEQLGLYAFLVVAGLIVLGFAVKTGEAKAGRQQPE